MMKCEYLHRLPKQLCQRSTHPISLFLPPVAITSFRRSYGSVPGNVEKITLKSLQRNYLLHPSPDFSEFHRAFEQGDLRSESVETFQSFIHFVDSAHRKGLLPVSFFDTVLQSMQSLKIPLVRGSIVRVIAAFAQRGNLEKVDMYIKMALENDVIIPVGVALQHKFTAAAESGHESLVHRYLESLRTQKYFYPSQTIDLPEDNHESINIINSFEAERRKVPKFTISRQLYFPLFEYYQRRSEPEKILKLRDTVLSISSPSLPVDNQILWALVCTDPEAAFKFHEEMSTWNETTSSLAIENASNLHYSPEQVINYVIKHPSGYLNVNSSLSPKFLVPALIKAHKILEPKNLIGVLWKLESTHPTKIWRNLCFSVLKSFAINGYIEETKLLLKFLQHKKVKIIPKTFEALVGMPTDREQCDLTLLLFKCFEPHLNTRTRENLKIDHITEKALVHMYNCRYWDEMREIVDVAKRWEVKFTELHVKNITGRPDSDEKFLEIVAPLMR